VGREILQKQLGLGVDVGHMQIHVDIDRDEPDWIEELMAVMDQLKMFQERMIQMMEAAMAASINEDSGSSPMSAG
jgi:hypothetical protein